MEGVFEFERTRVSDAGEVQGRFRSSGTAPKIMARMRVSGMELPPSIFDEASEVNA